MHEMSLVREIVDAVLEECSEAGVTKVDTVRLTIGELHDVVEEYIPGLFRYLARGTVASDAEVVIDRVPARLSCGRCGEVFRADPRNPRGWECPACHADGGFKLRSGMEFAIDSIEVEDAAADSRQCDAGERGRLSA
ncbi:MAG: hydrogenase maturation nickel metallochaperone HypA [Coriobacteriales bacterium]|jgi:hydrogenase nickel incorporation protein HypA/HybF